MVAFLFPHFPHRKYKKCCFSLSKRQKTPSDTNSVLAIFFFEIVTLRLLNALNGEDRGLKVRFSLAMIVFETFELILRQMLSSQGKNAPSNPYPHYLVRV